MPSTIKKTISRLIVLLFVLLPIFSLCAFSADVLSSDTASAGLISEDTTAVDPAAEGFFMTLNPEERYTGGDAYTEREVVQQQESTSKALYIGVIVLLLIITIIFISYKSRVGDEDEPEDTDIKKGKTTDNKNDENKPTE